jgi:hypothetical protein
MSKTVLKCGIIGGLIVFIWGMISWMVLPWHQIGFNKFTNEKEVQHVIKHNAPHSGIYLLPNMYADHAEQRMALDGSKAEEMKMLQEGPVMFASICLHGMYKMKATHIVIALITQIVGGCFIAWMLIQGKIKDYKKRVYFVTAVGFVVGLLGVFPAWTWWGFSAGYTLTLWADLLIGWFLAGLAMGKLSHHRA